MRGRLLVATPPLVDPNFDRTVILVLEHGDDGSLGLVLNRPSTTELDDVLPDWNDLASAPARVFFGGPVSPEAVIALARGDAEEDSGWVPLIDDLGTVDLGRDPALVASNVARAARVPRLRGLGARASCKPSSTTAPGSSSRRCPRTRSRRSPTRCGSNVLRRQRGRRRAVRIVPARSDGQLTGLSGPIVN